MDTLKKNFEFKRVLSRGKCINGKFLAIYVFPNKLNKVRVGFAIGKKAGTKLATKAGILGGIILIVIGLEIFITSFM